ncbi:MAG: hypothetical protein ACKORJ_12020 [Bacteroidota bacterium]
METSLEILLKKMAERTLTAEELNLLEEKSRQFSDLNKLVEARQEWREAMRKLYDEREKKKADDSAR